MSEAELQAMVLELQPQVGRQLQRIIQPDEHTLALRFLRRWVVLVAHPQLSRLHPLEQKPAAPETPPAFCMLLRKVLLNSPLRGLRRDPGDRIVHLDLPGGRLVAELMGRRSNLILLAPEGEVIGALKPRMLRDPVGQPYRLPAQGPPSVRRQTCRFDSGDQARRWFDQLIRRRREELLKRRCDRLLAKTRKTLGQVEQDLRRCQEADTLKKWADLLLAHQHQLPARGADTARVADLFEAGEPMDIPLNPRLDISQNAQRLYKRQRRLKKGVAHVSARLERARDRVDELQRLSDRLKEADQDQLEALDQQLEALDPHPAPARPRESAARTGKGRPFRSFEAADGSSILVGKSATENHRLTFHHARGRDTWLHLRDRPGSHGVIRARDAGAVAHETLLDAATLVAYFSGIKAGEDADVSYTLRKNVRPAGKPGLVYVSDTNTLHVVLQRQRLDRLLGKKGRI